MANNKYRPGDHVYVESSSNSPFVIRRIEELVKSTDGNVEAKVMCFYRRRDLPQTLVQLADKHQLATAEDSPLAMKFKKTWLRTPAGVEQAAQILLDPLIAVLGEPSSPTSGGKTDAPTPAPASASNGTSPNKCEPLTMKQRFLVKHRELFLSRQVESIPASQIRGKCSVTLLNETESLQSYLSNDDTFFYCLVYDPNAKTLLADKGEIRVGSRYQCEIPARLKDPSLDERKLEDTETLMWTPHHSLSSRQIDQFLVISRSVGTFARALDCSSSVKQPSLHMSAASASRDATLFHAMDILHTNNYSLQNAMSSLVPTAGPILCRDEIEDWSAPEANLFEDALEKYGKDFHDIRRDYLPWKTQKQIIEYYYMWKTTDRYVQQKRVKAVEAEAKIKQVFIPPYNYAKSLSTGKGNNTLYNGTSNGTDLSNNGKTCESCATSRSSQWFPFVMSHISCRLCCSCWDYWKKYGGLKSASKSEAEQELKRKASVDLSEDGKINDFSSRTVNRCETVGCGKEFKTKTILLRHYMQAHGGIMPTGSPRAATNTPSGFSMKTTHMGRLARIVCRDIIKTKKRARQNAVAVSTILVQQELTIRLSGKPQEDIQKLLSLKKKNRGSVTEIANQMRAAGSEPIEWLTLTPKDQMPQPDKVSFPKPPTAPDGSLVYERIPSKLIELDKDLSIIAVGGPIAPSAPRKRTFEEHHLNGTEVTIAPIGPPAKRPNKDPMPSHCPSPEQFAALMAASGQTIPRHYLNGKPKIAQISRAGNGRKQVVSWMDAPEDIRYKVNEHIKKLRRHYSVMVLRRSARKPFVPFPERPNVGQPFETSIVILD